MKRNTVKDIAPAEEFPETQKKMPKKSAPVCGATKKLKMMGIVYVIFL